ncbi:MAG: carbohydrate binding domain-containing protein, partial [Bacteroidetes bacterium]|nr:carbohydrate binding domain-containing protein [Bacteroidota bacterium]
MKKRRTYKMYSATIFCLFFIQHSFSQTFPDGFSFSLPAQDTSSGDFLPHFLAISISENNFNSIDGNGHFSINGKPIRFFGTNFSADAAFPVKSKAWFIAGRLRKMGFNLVRFHHLDNPWSVQSIFELGSDTRHLNTTTLDRMEYLISELKQNGIFVNMNLHVSRTFRAQDGIPDYDSLPEFSKGVNYFDPQHLALHKEYAKQLLTHRNPYTGKSLANDPVLAMVELTNENSLYRFWRDGALKPRRQKGLLAMRHVKMLDSLWNDFLIKKYSSTDSLRRAWSVGSVNREPSEQIRNGGFETGIASQWQIEKNGEVQTVWNNEIFNVYHGSISGKVTVTHTDGTDWHIQFKQTGLTVYKDSVYTISFAARADSLRKISVSIMKETSPWTWLGGTAVMLSPEWQNFSFTIRADVTLLSDVRLTFSLGAQAGTFWFDNISMKQPVTSGLSADESLEEKNIVRNEYVQCSALSDQRVKDLTSFYLKLETDYYVQMKLFLKDSLGIQVPIVGTNWNVGPADLSAQAEMDYIDNHTYWDHPQFPGVPWSSWDWSINNTPMVSSTHGGTITGLMAGAAMSKKPYTISEYNHPFPNRYQTEGVLLISSYASFHDVDGILYFDYNGSANDWESDFQSSYFNISRNAAILSLIPSCAFAYRNGLISKYEELISLQYSKDFLQRFPKLDNGTWQAVELFPSLLSLQHGVRVESYHAEATTDFSQFTDIPSTLFTSDTKELVWNTNGLFSVQTKKFVGVTGLLNQFTNSTIGPVILNSADKFGTITWLSLTEDSLSVSRKSLLSVSTRIQNTTMVWDGLTTIHDMWGTAPTEIEPINLTLSLAVYADSLYVFPLNVFGNTAGVKKIVYPSSANLFTISLDQKEFPSLWFGIEAFGEELTKVVVPEKSIPKEFQLLQNFPNPFNPSTTVTYALPYDTFVVVKLYDVMGREIRSLVNEYQSAGVHTIPFDASALSGGIYFYTLRAGN